MTSFVDIDVSLSWTRWSFYVASVLRRSLFMLMLLRPGHVMKLPLLIDFEGEDNRVESAGTKVRN